MSKIFLPNGTVFEYEKEVLSNETNSAITPEMVNEFWSKLINCFRAGIWSFSLFLERC